MMNQGEENVYTCEIMKTTQYTIREWSIYRMVLVLLWHIHVPYGDNSLQVCFVDLGFCAFYWYQILHYFNYVHEGLFLLIHFAFWCKSKEKSNFSPCKK